MDRSNGTNGASPSPTDAKSVGTRVADAAETALNQLRKPARAGANRAKRYIIDPGRDLYATLRDLTDLRGDVTALRTELGRVQAMMDQLRREVKYLKEQRQFSHNDAEVRAYGLDAPDEQEQRLAHWRRELPRITAAYEAIQRQPIERPTPDCATLRDALEQTDARWRALGVPLPEEWTPPATQTA